MADRRRYLEEVGEFLASHQIAQDAACVAHAEFIREAQAGHWNEAEAAMLRVLAYREAEMDAFMAACRRIADAAREIRGA